MIDRIFSDVRANLGNPERLTLILLDIIDDYREQAKSYANAVMAEASTFNAEMEDNFKPSVTKAEYRAKELSGSQKIIAEREMKALEMLFEVVKMILESSLKNKVP